ncbi:MAG: membrane lipoprotein lipid attachment site-containing protein [Chlorobi bacterium]|nr:membrane lipoprotein lipid attachment site-containing protein [Chlorobiota bacterium]
MKRIIYIFSILILLSSCSTPIDYSKHKELEGITVELIRDFYESGLKPVLGLEYLATIPLKKENVLDVLPKNLDTNSRLFYYHIQYEKFKHLNWDDIIERERMLPPSELRKVFKKPEGGWRKYLDTYGGEPLCFVSMPQFSRDLKTVYIDLQRRSNGICWVDYTMYFTLGKDGKWIKKSEFIRRHT